MSSGWEHLKYPDNSGVPQGSPLRHALFLLHIKDLPDDVICVNN